MNGHLRRPRSAATSAFDHLAFKWGYASDGLNVSDLHEAVPGSGWVLHGSSSLALPSGSTDLRPAAPAGGSLRYNDETASLEMYGGTEEWLAIGGQSLVVDSLHVKEHLQVGNTDTAVHVRDQYVSAPSFYGANTAHSKLEIVEDAMRFDGLTVELGGGGQQSANGGGLTLMDGASSPKSLLWNADSDQWRFGQGASAPTLQTGRMVVEDDVVADALTVQGNASVGGVLHVSDLTVQSGGAVQINNEGGDPALTTVQVNGGIVCNAVTVGSNTVYVTETYLAAPRVAGEQCLSGIPTLLRVEPVTLPACVPAGPHEYVDEEGTARTATNDAALRPEERLPRAAVAALGVTTFGLPSLDVSAFASHFGTRHRVADHCAAHSVQLHAEDDPSLHGQPVLVGLFRNDRPVVCSHAATLASGEARAQSGPGPASGAGDAGHGAPFVRTFWREGEGGRVGAFVRLGWADPAEVAGLPEDDPLLARGSAVQAEPALHENLLRPGDVVTCVLLNPLERELLVSATVELRTLGLNPKRASVGDPPAIGDFFYETDLAAEPHRPY